MAGLIDIAAGVMSQAGRRVEMAGQNIANISTPGYKRRVQFGGLLAGQAATPADAAMVPDLSAGRLSETGAPCDLAIEGEGFFTVNVAGRTLYTRQGQFRLDADGRLVTGQGFAVQQEGGGDIRLKSLDFKVLGDGTIVEEGAPVAKLALVQIVDPHTAAYADGGMLGAPEDGVRPAEAALLRQGALEASNVSMGDEMMTMMEALRRAEAGQRLAGVYDDLMGRVLTTFGQS